MADKKNMITTGIDIVGVERKRLEEKALRDKALASFDSFYSAEVNFRPFGSTILLEIGDTVSEGGVLMPDQARESGQELERDEAYKVASITKGGLDSLFGENIRPDEIMKNGLWVYFKDGASPTVIFEENDKRYAIVDSYDIAGWAPRGFDRKEWLKKKEEKTKREEALAKKRREDLKASVLKGGKSSGIKGPTR